MRIAWWIPKVANKHLDYVILIIFHCKKWLHERASLLRCTYIVSLVEYWLVTTGKKKSLWMLVMLRNVTHVQRLSKMYVTNKNCCSGSESIPGRTAQVRLSCPG